MHVQPLFKWPLVSAPFPILSHSLVKCHDAQVRFQLGDKGADSASASESASGGGCRLYLVGHSLGGGAAAILGLVLLRRFPHLRCFVFSPPGGLLTWPAAEATRPFVTTVVVGKDVVPRLGLAQMETLRAQILHLLKTSKDTKVGHESGSRSHSLWLCSSAVAN